MTSWIAPDLFKPNAPPAWPFAPCKAGHATLVPQAYDFIMADPPWHMVMYSQAGEGKSPQAHYATMSLDDIAALPVADLARADCRLWLWATTPLLPDQLDIMRVWGFKYSTSAVWAKRTVNGKRHFGTGYGGFRGEHEYILVGTRGNPGEAASKSIRSIIEAQAGEHSEKPSLAYKLAELMYPRARRADLFSRHNRAGWDSWGREAGKFDGGEA